MFSFGHDKRKSRKKKGRKKAGRKLSAWQRHAGRVMRAGGTMAQAAASYRKGKSGKKYASGRKAKVSKARKSFGGIAAQIASLGSRFDSIAGEKRKKRLHNKAKHTKKRASNALATLHKAQKAMEALNKKFAAAGKRLQARAALTSAKRLAMAKADLARAMSLASAGFLSEAHVAKLKKAVEKAERTGKSAKKSGKISYSFPKGWDEYGGGFSGGYDDGDRHRSAYENDPRRKRRKKKASSKRRRKSGSPKKRRKASTSRRRSHARRPKHHAKKRRSSRARGRKPSSKQKSKMKAGQKRYQAFLRKAKRAGKTQKQAQKAWKAHRRATGRDF
jgi:hypothetical protein